MSAHEPMVGSNETVARVTELASAPSTFTRWMISRGSSEHALVMSSSRSLGFTEMHFCSSGVRCFVLDDLRRAGSSSCPGDTGANARGTAETHIRQSEDGEVGSEVWVSALGPIRRQRPTPGDAVLVARTTEIAPQPAGATH